MRKLIVIVENGVVTLYGERPYIVETITLDGQPEEFVENVKRSIVDNTRKHKILGLPELRIEESCPANE